MDESFERMLGDFQRADTMVTRRKLEKMEQENQALAQRLDNLARMVQAAATGVDGGSSGGRDGSGSAAASLVETEQDDGGEGDIESSD
jgi:hypothetical protein